MKGREGNRCTRPFLIAVSFALAAAAAWAGPPAQPDRLEVGRASPWPPRMTAPNDRFADRQGATPTPTATRPPRSVPRHQNRPTTLSFTSRPAPDVPPSFANTVLTLHATSPDTGPSSTAISPPPLPDAGTTASALPPLPDAVTTASAPPPRPDAVTIASTLHSLPVPVPTTNSPPPLPTPVPPSPAPKQASRQATAIDLDRTFFAWDPTPSHGAAPEMTERRGLAPETVTATWLLPDRLLWVRWDTCAEGTGRFIEEGHLLLLANGADWVELLRDRFGALERFDDGEFVTTRMSITRQGQTLTLSKTHVEEEWSEEKPPVWSALARRHWHGGGKRFFANIRTVEEWQYLIGTDTWTYIGGRHFFETGRQALPIEAIASRFDLAPAALRQLNPAQARKTRWRGRIVLAAPLPPYPASPTAPPSPEP